MRIRDDASRRRQLGLFKMVRGAGEMRVCGYVLFYAEQTPVSRVTEKNARVSFGVFQARHTGYFSVW